MAGRPRDRREHDPQECRWCGEQYVPKQLKAAAAFCSPQCKGRHRHWIAAGKREQSKPTDRFCLHCGVTMPQKMRSDAAFCSSECNLSAHRLNRTLRRRTGEGLTGWLRAEIFMRDKWICGICRRKVDPDLRYPDPQAPSLDHVVPVAQGGDHEPANLRLAHLGCNVSRRDKGGNEQLAIT